MPEFEDGDLVRAAAADEDHPDTAELGIVLVAEDANGHTHVEWQHGHNVELWPPEDLELVDRKPTLEEGDSVLSTVDGAFGKVVVPRDANGDLQVDWERRGITTIPRDRLVLVRQERNTRGAD